MKRISAKFLLNAVIYVAEGDLANSALSGASAIPFVGIFSTTTKIVKTNVKSKKVVKWAGGAKPLENAPYIKDGKPNGRPQLSGNKKIQFEKDLYNKNIDPYGILRDPNTGDVIDWKPGQPRKDMIDFGHNSGNNYKDMFQKYKNRDITLDELKTFQYDSTNYRLEKPSANRSHKYE